MRDSVPSVRYSSVCNVLRQWSISLMPTYRVYRLYDTVYQPRMGHYIVWAIYVPGKTWYRLCTNKIHFLPRNHSCFIGQAKGFLTKARRGRQLAKYRHSLQRNELESMYHVPCSHIMCHVHISYVQIGKWCQQHALPIWY